MMRVGSLCSGIGGLDLGLHLAGVPVHQAFVSDIDDGACTWLEANIEAENIGDFTAHDELPEVDVLTAGFPCQPVSLAGQRKGVDDERWLFDDICRLVGRMETRPVLFLENVPGLLTANSGEAMARVVHGLASISYHIGWGTLTAASVGAPHQRNRWWGVAWHPESDQLAACRASLGSRWLAQVEAGESGPPTGQVAADPDGTRREGERFAVAGEPQEPWDRGDRHASPDSAGSERRGPEQQHLPSPTGPAAEPGERARALTERFGPYAGAIGRWECVLGRTAPDPSVDGRLNPSFCEWMMGYPEGWVTDTLPSRNHSLKALGNAVVPQCASEAFTQLVQRGRVA